MKTQVQRATVEGLETDALRKKILTDKFKQIEDDNLFLAGKDKNGDVLKFQFINCLENKKTFVFTYCSHMKSNMFVH